MTPAELRDKIAKSREQLKERAGMPMVSSEHGPIGIGLVEAIASVLEAQENRIAELEAKIK